MRGYAARGDGPIHKILMHRLILARVIGRPLQPLEETDHKDGNPLNNRRDNLRIATRSQNSQNRERQTNNTSGYRGVSFVPATGKWRVDLKGMYLGQFNTPEEASAAYESRARQEFGEWYRP
jgi:hypothetical protein